VRKGALLWLALILVGYTPIHLGPPPVPTAAQVFEGPPIAHWHLAPSRDGPANTTDTGHCYAAPHSNAPTYLHAGTYGDATAHRHTNTATHSNARIYTYAGPFA